MNNKTVKLIIESKRSKLDHHTCTTSSFIEAHRGSWLPPIIFMLVLVIFLISDTIAPPFPNRHPTWFDGTTSLKEIRYALEPTSASFSALPSTNLSKTHRIAFWAADCRMSRFYTIK